MKKIFLSLVAVVSAVTLMAQESPTACDAQIEFKYCFTTTSNVSLRRYSSELPYTYKYEYLGEQKEVTFTAIGQTKTVTIMNKRGCDSIMTLTLAEKEPPVGAAGGKNAKAFTVNDQGKQVFFSQGNLEYCPNPLSEPKTHKVADGEPKAGIFRFAVNQYDYVGISSYWAADHPGNVYYKDGSGNDVLCNQNGTNDANYNGWIDIFCWATSGYKQSPLLHSTETKDYGDYDSGKNLSGTNYDWGVFNAISNGGDEPGLWRTLTADEWRYILLQRPNADSKQGFATIKNDNGGVVAYGYILLPDQFTLPQGITFDSNSNKPDFDKSANNYTIAQWQQMEAAGAVFFPSAGVRKTDNTYGFSIGEGLRYWAIDKPHVAKLSYLYVTDLQPTYEQPVRLIADK